MGTTGLGSESPETDSATPSTGRMETKLESNGIRIDRELTATEIQEGVWLITHRLPYPANSLVVEGDDGSLLLVDTPWTAGETKTLIDWLDQRFDSPPKKAVNTHFHLDALGGNPALRDARIPTRGHFLTRQLLEHRGVRRIKELRMGLADRPTQRDRFRGIQIVAPGGLYVASDFRLPLGSETYALLHPGAAHSPDNLAVYFPSRKLLFGGCMVKGGSSLGYLGDADLENWPAAIKKLQTLEVETVVTGHGDRMDPGVLENTLELLAAERAKPPVESEDVSPNR